MSEWGLPSWSSSSFTSWLPSSLKPFIPGNFSVYLPLTTYLPLLTLLLCFRQLLKPLEQPNPTNSHVLAFLSVVIPSTSLLSLYSHPHVQALRISKLIMKRKLSLIFAWSRSESGWYRALGKNSPHRAAGDEGKGKSGSCSLRVRQSARTHISSGSRTQGLKSLTSSVFPLHPTPTSFLDILSVWFLQALNSFTSSVFILHPTLISLLVNILSVWFAGTST